jgi:choline-sulfatase
MGYRTALAGKMHFVGPDQLHGFEERLTTDIYPADFGWTPDWEQPDTHQDYFRNCPGTGSMVMRCGDARTDYQGFP